MLNKSHHSKGWLTNPGVVFLFRFIVLFVVLYGFNIFFIGVTSPAGSLYSALLDHHLNFIEWWRSAILHVSNLFAHLFGLNSHVELPFTLRAWQGRAVRIVYSCIGYGVTSFWCAFVLANTATWTKKLYWVCLGVVGLFIVNCLRISLLLLAVQNHWRVSRFFDHHTLFNIAAYGLIFTLMYLYTRKPQTVTRKAADNGAKTLAGAEKGALP